MKNYLKSEFRISSTYSPEQKKIAALHTLYSAILFVLVGFSMFETLYIMCNCIGAVVSGSADVAIRDLIRMLPLFLFTIILAHASLNLVTIDYESSQKQRNKRLKNNGIALIILGAIQSIYVLVLVIVKKYASFVEGYPTKLFPLDYFIFGLLTICLGVIALLWYKKHKDGDAFILPYHNSHKGLARRGFDRVFYFLFLLGAGYSLAAFIFSFGFADWSHGHIFYVIMLDLLFLDCVFNFIAYRYIYLGVKDEYKAAAERQIGLVMMVQGVIVYGVYMLAFSMDLEAPNLVCTALLPVEYTASFNAATFLYILFDIVPGLVAFLKSFIDKRKAK